MIRAVLEGICYHLRWLLECVEKKVKTSDIIRFVGGGALSPLTAQMLADITVRTVKTVNNSQIDIVGVAKACGYPYAVSVDSFEALDKALAEVKNRNGLSLIEVKCSIGARDDLGRPTTTAIENKENYMNYLCGL